MAFSFMSKNRITITVFKRSHWSTFYILFRLKKNSKKNTFKKNTFYESLVYYHIFRIYKAGHSVNYVEIASLCLAIAFYLAAQTTEENVKK